MITEKPRDLDSGLGTEARKATFRPISSGEKSTGVGWVGKVMIGPLLLSRPPDKKQILFLKTTSTADAGILGNPFSAPFLSVALVGAGLFLPTAFGDTCLKELVVSLGLEELLPEFETALGLGERLVELEMDLGAGGDWDLVSLLGLLGSWCLFGTKFGVSLLTRS